MATPFAKLFETEHGQFLVTTETGDDGPCLKLRAASVMGVEASVNLGPWSDDDAGWDHVEKLLADFTLGEATDRAAQMQQMVRNLMTDAA